MRQPHLGRQRINVMASFIQAKQVKSYPGSLSQVALLCVYAQRAMHCNCHLAAWQQPGEDVLWSGLTVPCLCACCVWSRCLGQAEHTRQQMPIQAATFSCHSVFPPPPISFMLPFHMFALSPCGAVLLLHSLFFLKEHRSLSGKVEAASSAGNIQHLGRSPFSSQEAFMLGCSRCFLAHFHLCCLTQWAVSAEMFFHWLCPNMPCIVQFTWLCFLPQTLTKSIPCSLSARKLYSALFSRLEDRLCDRDD